MEPAKFKKLQEYVNTLVEQGESFEKDKEYSIAIGKFLKVVDVLLIMADAAPDHPSWLKCTDKAAAFQKKVKNLIALAVLQKEKEEAGQSTANPASTSQPATPSVPLSHSTDRLA
jgi:hypothetical protein